jgi:hypothetical protein
VKTSRLAPLMTLLVGGLILSAVPGPVLAYVEAPMSLGAVVSQSSNIVLMEVVAVDKEKNLIIYRKVRDIKGKHPLDTIKHNIGRGGLRPNEWKPQMDWAEPGKKAVFFHNGGASETCIGTWWYQAYGGGEWWNHSHAEPFLLRSFCGQPEKLATVVADMLEGKEVVVPCMVDGNKDDLHNRKAKIQRLKASLKLQDYNAKRDFVGWGGEDFRRLVGMPGFTHYTGLTRVDPEAQAISSVDIDGDGKMDLCLVGGGRVVLLQNGGESLNELSLPAAGACRAAVWADYNADGKPDLLLATPAGLRLCTNLGGTFRDDSGLLPAGSELPATAAAWIDADGDGRPDILSAHGYHGLRLYRNALDAGPLLANLDSDSFPARDKATAQLEKIGPVLEPALRAALTGKISAEKRMRIEKVLARWKNPSPPSPPEKRQSGFTWFQDLSADAGLGSDGIGANLKGDTLTVCDVNADGRPDLLYGGGTGMLVLNQGAEGGKARFAHAKESGISFAPGRVGPVFGDFDGDGAPDLFVPQKGQCKLFHNDGKGRFTDVTAKAGALANTIGCATSAAWGDFDNDGKLDLFVGCLRGPNRFFHNKGDGTFEDASEKIGLSQRLFNTQAICLVDLNNDGCLDAVFNNEGQESAVLLGDPAQTDKRVSVSLTVGGKLGVIGSRVVVADKQGRTVGSQEISGGDGRGQNGPLARFALLPGTYRVQVRFSSGLTRQRDITVASAPVRSVIDDR